MPTIKNVPVLPGPKLPPLVGALPQLRRFVQDSVGVSHDLFREHGNLVGLAVRRGVRLYSPESDCPGIALVYGPKAAQELAARHKVYAKYPLTGSGFPKGEPTPRTRPLKHFLTGLFAVNGDTHRQHRRLLMPAFQKSRIEAYRDDIVAIAESVFTRWSPGQVINVSAAMRWLTLRVAIKALFGEDAANDLIPLFDKQTGRTSA